MLSLMETLEAQLHSPPFLSPSQVGISRAVPCTMDKTWREWRRKTAISRCSPHLDGTATAVVVSKVLISRTIRTEASWSQEAKVQSTTGLIVVPIRRAFIRPAALTVINHFSSPEGICFRYCECLPAVPVHMSALPAGQLLDLWLAGQWHQARN